MCLGQGLGVSVQLKKFQNFVSGHTVYNFKKKDLKLCMVGSAISGQFVEAPCILSFEL